MIVSLHLYRLPRTVTDNASSGLLKLFLMTAVLLVSACSSLPKDVQRTPSSALENTSSTSLARQIRPMSNRHPGLSGFHVLADGADAYAARLRLIKAAEQSIDVQYYIWHDDLTGKVMHNQLLHAADRGVRVRLLLDDLDTAGKDRLLGMIDAHPNIEVRVYNPFANRSNRGVDFITDTRRVNRRMHNKTITFDNQATIFGGRNIGDEYFSAAEDVGFGDLDALAIGPVAQEVSSQFDLYWNSKWVYPLAAFPQDPSITADDIKAYRQQSDAEMEEAKSSRYAGVLRQAEAAKASELSQLSFAWSKWLLAFDQPSKVEATEVTAATHLAPQLKEGMDRTMDELIVVSPYFVPGDDFTAYLTGLVDKGVRVRILTNSLQANDVSLVHAGYMRYRKDLIEGGVELYEFKATRNEKLEKKQGRNRIGASRASLHAKFFGFDKRYLFIGSFNLDARSATLNTEFGAYFESPEYAEHLSQLFDQQVMLVAYQVTLDKDGKLEWITKSEEGTETRVDKEPDTTGWKRFSTRFLSLIVPESQL